MFAGGHFPGILLAGVTQFLQLGVAVEGVGVQVHLGIQGQQRAFLGHHQGIDLQQAGIQVLHQPVEVQQQAGERGDLLAFQPEGEGEVAALVGLQAGRRVYRFGNDRLGGFRRHLLDVHAAAGRGHEHHLFAGAVHQHAQVQFPRDAHGLLDEQTMHRQARVTGLVGHQGGAQQLVGEVGQVVEALHHPHPAGLAASAAVHLGLHHPASPAQRLGGGQGLIGAVRHAALGNGDAITGEQLLGLVFVKMHAGLPGVGKDVLWNIGVGSAKVPEAGPFSPCVLSPQPGN